MLPIGSVANSLMNITINFKTLDRPNFSLSFLKTDNVLKVSAEICAFLNSKTGIKLIYAGSILQENKKIGDVKPEFSYNPLLVVFIKTLKPQIYEEQNEICGQGCMEFEHRREAMPSSVPLSQNSPTPFQKRNLDSEYATIIGGIKLSSRFTPLERIVPTFGRLYQLGLFPYEELIQDNDGHCDFDQYDVYGRDFVNYRNRQLLLDLQKVSAKVHHNPFIMNTVFDDFAHFCPDIIKRLKANPEELQNIESLLGSRDEFYTSDTSDNENSDSSFSISSTGSPNFPSEEAMCIERVFIRFLLLKKAHSIFCNP
ncbi:hypothetical protein HZS_5005 [Henneguya salminicola]|nr:hypothetical protein HZS_5005 [Henneguya salminicola]